MKKETTLDKFASMPAHKAVMSNAFPAMAAMLMVLIYNLADTFFIGQTHDALQVAAVSLATPVFLLFTAIGTLFGVGGTSVISRAMGEGRKEYAKKVSSFCMWTCVVIGIVMAVLLWIFLDQLLVMVGASENTWDFAKSYLSIVIGCGPFVLIGNCYSNVLRAEGKVTDAMMGMMIGNLLNVILDPVMILVFDWGITGAAIATVVGNIFGAAYYIIYFLRGKSMLSIKIKDFSMGDGIFKGVFAIGIPASLGSILMSVSQIVANSLMSEYGDMSVAGLGVSMKVVMIIGMLCIGLGQGIQPLLGYFVGAKNWKKYKEIFKFSMIFAFLVSLVMTAFSYIFVNQIVSAFLTEPSAFEYGVRFSRILLSTNIIFGIFYVLSNALQAMGAAMPSLIINMSRQGIIYIPVLVILNIVMGENGILWAQPVADVSSVILAAALNWIMLKKMMAKTQENKKVQDIEEIQGIQDMTQM